MKKTLYSLFIFLIVVSALNSQTKDSGSIKNYNYNIASFGLGGGFQSVGLLSKTAPYKSGYEGLIFLQVNVSRVVSLFASHYAGGIKINKDSSYSFPSNFKDGEMVTSNVTIFGAKFYGRGDKISPYAKLGFAVISRYLKEGPGLNLGLGGEYPVSKLLKIFVNLDLIFQINISSDNDPNKLKKPNASSNFHIGCGIMFF